MAPQEPEAITQLLAAWSAGDRAALDALVPLVYAPLRRLAHHYMAGERAEHLLQTSALLNEAYLRLVDYRSMSVRDRAHFFALAAQLMRRILVEYARNRQAAKRGGGGGVRILPDAAVEEPSPVDLIALDDALNQLASIDERGSRIVELRYFGGLNIDETAEALAISTASVERGWRFARAWLHRALTGAKDQNPSS